MKSLLLFFILCFVQVSFAQLYQKKLNVYSSHLQIKHKVFHKGSQSFLLIKCTNASFVRIEFKAYTDYNGREILYNYERNFRDATNKTYKIEIPVTVPIYVLQIHIIDLDKHNNTFKDLIPINRLQDNNQSIYLLDAVSQKPLLNNYLTPEQEFTLEHRLPATKQFYIKYFKTSFAAAAPPDGTISQKFNPLTNYDALYQVPRGKGLKLTEPGLYFVQTDSNSNKGIFLSCHTNSFPATTSIKDLSVSLRYITKQEEYENILYSKNQKLALDKYWLERRQTHSRNLKKAKSLIAIYYNRIQNANLQFTSYKEGWKTDRGMIYVIFGEPNVVRKYATQEVWFYQSNYDRYPVEFIFDRIGEQYLLKRNPQLREPWRAEVEHWRKGVVNF